MTLAARGPHDDARQVFLKAYTELAVDFADLQMAMLRRPRRWAAGLAEVVERDGASLLMDVGLDVAGRKVTRHAWLRLGEAVASERVVSLPLLLRVEDQDRLFPSLDGSLVAAWLGPGRTQLELSAQYDPPMGVLGRALDRALLHRVTEAVVRRLLEKVGGRLAAEASGAAGNPALDQG